MKSRKITIHRMIYEVISDLTLFMYSPEDTDMHETEINGRLDRVTERDSDVSLYLEIRCRVGAHEARWFLLIQVYE